MLNALWNFASSTSQEPIRETKGIIHLLWRSSKSRVRQGPRLVPHLSRPVEAESSRAATKWARLMANSEYEYTRLFERQDNLLPNTWIVIRIDGHGFHKFSAKYNFEKPNDPRALKLMNRAAEGVLAELSDICLAYGQSDEYSFIFHPETQLYERRESKLVSTVVSIFTAHYVHAWPSAYPEKPLSVPLPSFDGRAVLYPSLKNLRDYLSWRQADCHINNLFNTTFWALVHKGNMSRTSAERELSGTFAADKHDILFKRFGVNYNKEPEIYRKGSVVFRDCYVDASHPVSLPATPIQPQRLGPEQSELASIECSDISSDRPPGESQLEARPGKPKVKNRIVIAHCDIIGDSFWQAHPWILEHGAERKRTVRKFFGGREESEEG